jgi:lactoylglutathione lyase
MLIAENPERRDDMSEAPNGKARLVGINHVALEVGDIEEALAFYGRLFDFRLRGRSKSMAFIDMGDQFIALATGRTQPKDEARHFGLVVDDRASLRRALEEAGAEVLPSRGLDFLDPWGNYIQVVEYRDIQYTKAPAVLDAMDLGQLDKSEAALQELADKGIRTEGLRST